MIDNSTEEITIRIAGVVRESIVDGPGIRFVVFCQGCPHKCPGCHNETTHDFDGGKDVSVQKIMAEIDANPMLMGVTFSGGEPVCQSRGFLELAREIKKRNLNIIMYSGYTYEEIQKMSEEDDCLRELSDIVDYIVDGRYRQEERDLTLSFRGSRNQTIVDITASKQAGKKITVEL